MTTLDSKPRAVIFCAQHEVVREFYRAVLGAQVVAIYDDHSILEIHGLDLVIHPVPPHVLGPPDPAKPVPRRWDVAIKLMFPVPSIAEARALADENGGQIDPPDAEWTWESLRSCMGQDPEGNVFEVFEQAVPLT